jgi:hypothetical protein
MRRRLFLAMVTILSLATFGYAEGTKRATPPTAKELVGVWIGFDQDELTFTRLELRADSTGYCARVYPSDTILHHFGVKVYRVNKWSISDWNITIDLTPISSNAESVHFNGRAGTASLKLEIVGLKTKWKRELLLSPESRIETSNQETKQAIGEAQK